MTDAFFRAGVGAVVLDSSRRILVMKRKDVAGDEGWQLPQGGIGIGEDPLEALYRELQEETGLGRDQIRVVRSMPEWLTYELPANYRNSKVGWGQVQRWYLCRLVGAAQQAVKPDQMEFSAVDWVTANQLLERAVRFRQPLYRRVVNEFDLLGVAAS